MEPVRVCVHIKKNSASELGKLRLILFASDFLKSAPNRANEAETPYCIPLSGAIVAVP